MQVHFCLNTESVGDPGFPRGGANSQSGYANLLFHIFAENCMEMKEFRTPKGRACSRSPLGSTDANSHRISLNYIAYYLPHIFFGARAIFCSNESYRHIPWAKDDIWKYPFVILVEWPLEGLTKWYIPSCLQRQPASAIFFSFSEKAEYSFLSERSRDMVR